IPTAVLPYVNTAMAAHPAYGRSLDQLRAMGVLIGSYEPHRPKTGGGAGRFRWEEALELLEDKIADARAGS
ncbi:flavoprotein, partial [Streptomyces sp. SID2563]|nr:flavoprotein [Streptomyces sp. SID2563]